MQITEIKKGTRVSDDIRTDSFLELSGGVAQYLASDDTYGHALLHIMPAEGHCRSFRYDPLKRVPPRPAALRTDNLKEEDFSL